MSEKRVKSFVTLKKEAYADAEADFAAQGEPLPHGYVPPIDLWQIPQFRDEEETKAIEANPTPVYQRLKKRREARAAAEEDAAEEYRQELQEKKKKKETAWLEAISKRKADRERDARERQERQKLQRENAALVRANKRRRDDGDADSQATPRKQGTRDTMKQPNVVVTGGARISHGNSRWRPMVVDSDDDVEILPRAKRIRTSKGESPVVVRADASPKKRKRDTEDSDDESLSSKMKRRRFETVRPESNKENLGQKKALTEVAKVGNLPNARVRRPAALLAEKKMSATAGISKTKAVKKPVRQVKVAKDEPAKESNAANGEPAGAGPKTKTRPVPSRRPIQAQDDPFRSSSSSGDGGQRKTTRLTQKLRRASGEGPRQAYKSARTEEELWHSVIFARRW